MIILLILLILFMLFIFSMLSQQTDRSLDEEIDDWIEFEECMEDEEL